MPLLARTRWTTATSEDATKREPTAAGWGALLI